MCDWTSMEGEGSGDFPSLSLDNNLCDNCEKLKEELKKVQDEQTANFLALKEKIISTDLLIKKYTSKCQEYDVQRKKLEDTTEKYVQFKRDCELLEVQLKEALQEKEPLKVANIRLEKQNSKLESEKQEIKDQIDSTKFMNKQYEAAQETLNQERIEFKRQRLQIVEENKQLKNSTKRCEELLKKTEDQLKKSKNDAQGRQAEIRTLETKVRKLEIHIVDKDNILQSHGLLTDSGHLKSNVQVTSNTAARPGVTNLQSRVSEICNATKETNLTTSMDKGAAPNTASFASRKKNNEYAQGRFQSAGFLTTACEENVRPNPELMQPERDTEEKTHGQVLKQVSQDSSQISAKENEVSLSLNKKQLESSKLNSSESDTSEDKSGQEVDDSDVDYIEQLVTQLSDAESDDAIFRYSLHKPLDAVLSPLPQSPCVKPHKLPSDIDLMSSDESDDEYAKLMEAQLESPPLGRRKKKTYSMKSTSPNVISSRIECSSRSSQDTEQSTEKPKPKDNVRRSPRLADTKEKSPTKDPFEVPITDNPNPMESVHEESQSDNDESIKRGMITKQRGRLENDLELSSSESDAESVASSTGRRRIPRNSRTLWQDGFQRIDSPRRTRKSSDCSDSSDSSAISPRGEHNTRLTRSRRLSESSNDSFISPKVEITGRNTRMRKVSDSSDSESKSISSPETQARRVTRSSPKDTTTIDITTAESRSTQLPISPQEVDLPQDKSAQLFKEPLPFSPRTRRKTISESLEVLDQDSKSQFKDKRVTRSRSCPGGSVEKESDTTTRKRTQSASPNKTENHNETENQIKLGLVKYPNNKSRRDRLTKQLARLASQADSSEVKTNKKEHSESHVVVATDIIGDDDVKSQLKRTLVNEKSENEKSDPETPTRVTRSQGKSVKSCEVIKQEGELERIRQARTRKRSGGQCSESDEEKTILKKRNRYKSRIDSGSEEETRDNNASKRVSNSPPEKSREQNTQGPALVNGETEVADQMRSTRSSSKVLTRQMSVHEENASSDNACRKESIKNKGDKSNVVQWYLSDDETESAQEDKKERKIVHPEERQIDRVGSLGFLYQKSSLDKVDVNANPSESTSGQQMLTPKIIPGGENNKQPSLERNSSADKHFKSEESLDLDNFLLSESSSGTTLTGASKYSDLHHHAVSLDDLEDLNDEATSDIPLSESSSMVLNLKFSASGGLVRDNSLEGTGSSLLSKDLSDRISPLSFASDQSRPISPLSVSDTESLAPLLSPLPPTPEMYGFDELDDFCDNEDIYPSSEPHGDLDTPPLPEYANETVPRENREVSSEREKTDSDYFNPISKIGKIRNSHDNTENVSESKKDALNESCSVNPSVDISDEKGVAQNKQTKKPRKQKKAESSSNTHKTGVDTHSKYSEDQRCTEAQFDTDTVYDSGGHLNVPGAFIKLGGSAKKGNTKPKLLTKLEEFNQRKGAGNKMGITMSKVEFVKKASEKLKSNLQKARTKGAKIDAINIVPTRQHSHNPISTRYRKPSSDVIQGQSEPVKNITGANNIAEPVQDRNAAEDCTSTTITTAVGAKSDPQHLEHLKQKRRVSRVKSSDIISAATNIGQIPTHVVPKSEEEFKPTKSDGDVACDIEQSELPKGKTSDQFKRRTSRFPSSRKVKSTDESSQVEAKEQIKKDLPKRKRAQSCESVAKTMEPKAKKTLIAQPKINDQKFIQQTITAEKKISNEVQLLVKFRSTMEKDVCRKLQGIPGATQPRIVNVVLQLLKNQHADLVQLLFSYCRHPISSDQWVPCMADHELKLMNLLKHLDLSMAGTTELFVTQGTELLLRSNDTRSVSVITLAGICRVIVGLLRQKDLPVQAKVFVYNLIYHKVPGCPVLLLATAAVWPHPLFKFNYTEDPVLTVMEYIVMKDMLQNKTHNVKVFQCLTSLLCWKAPEENSTMLAECLLDKLMMLSAANELKDVIGNTCKALELLSSYEPWNWINDVFIIELVWPNLKKYVMSPINAGIPSRFVEFLLEVLALATCRCPSDHKDAACGVMQWLNAFVTEPHCSNVPLSVQMPAMKALLKLAPFGPIQVAATSRQWLQVHRDEISADTKETIATFLENYKSEIESVTNYPA